MRTAGLVILWLCAAGDNFGQVSAAPQPTFEAASVKLSEPGILGLFTRFLPGGGAHITGATMKGLVGIAYSVRTFQFPAALRGSIRNASMWMREWTGLTGNYDFEPKWTPVVLSAASADAPLPTDPDRPSIFTALEEQLGLRLESTKGPVEVLVIRSR